MNSHYTRLLELAAQRNLSDADRNEVGSIYNAVADSAKSAMREDCLLIIKSRLWNM